MKNLDTMPNSMGAVKRANASVSADSSLSGSVVDVTAMSFKMRSKVESYEAVQSRVPADRSVNCNVRRGPVLEWKEMANRRFFLQPPPKQCFSLEI